jgi:hypothetical protein
MVERKNNNIYVTTIMLNILYCFCFLIVYSCSNHNQQDNQNTSNLEKFKILDTIVFFSGCWLSENYYNNINKTKSPRIAQDIGSEFIVIPSRTLQPTVMDFGFHEASQVLKVLKHGNAYEIWEVRNDSLAKFIYAINIISPTKIKLNNNTFIKINPIINQGKIKILEEILFKGTYSNNDGKIIKFNRSGEVNGLDTFCYFSPIIDYISPGSQVDQVLLSTAQNYNEKFGFKFNKDTLELYKLECLTFDTTSNICFEVDYGDLLYKLWRI